MMVGRSTDLVLVLVLVVTGMVVVSVVVSVVPFVAFLLIVVVSSFSLQVTVALTLLHLFVALLQ